MSKQVYNLIFPNNCKQLQICGYVFTRIPEYDKNVQSLQHLVPLFSESNYIINTGTHAVTAYLDLPLKEEKSIINWDNKKTTALEDILLLLSIFTHRDVFVMSEPIEKGKAAITADPRIHYFGLGYSGELQKGIEKAYIKMQTTLWKKQYGDGVFLSLFRSACRRQLLESSFFICFTIWEKLFTLHNQPKLSDNQIKNTYTSKKSQIYLLNIKLKKHIIQNIKKVSKI